MPGIASNASSFARERKNTRSASKQVKDEDPKNSEVLRTLKANSPIKKGKDSSTRSRSRAKTSPSKPTGKKVSNAETKVKKHNVDSDTVLSPIKKLVIKIDKGNRASKVAVLVTPKKQQPCENSSPFKALETAKQLSLKSVESPVRSSPRKNLFCDANDENVSPSKKPSLAFSTPTKVQQDCCNVLSPRKKLDFNHEIRSSPRKAEQSIALHAPDVKQFASARKALSTTHPDNLVGRLSQLKEMQQFLQLNFSQSKNKSKSQSQNTSEQVKKSLYVSGPPGTGKTTCLKHLVSTLPELINGQVMCSFINCMALGSSVKVFKKIAETILPKSKANISGESVAEIKKVLEEELTLSKKWILLVLDEIDQLESKCQEVLYTLFEWPYLKNSKLVLVGIANALDLTDRILPRITLRTSIIPQEINFPAYTKDEIIKIISSRLNQMNANKEQAIIKPVAISFLAAKISALSGDVRKALDVCRRAIELAELEVRKQSLLKPQNSGSIALPIKPIEIQQIMKIFNEVYCSSVTNSMGQKDSDLPLHQKLLMASLLLLNSHHKKSKEVTMGKLHETYSKVCKKRNMTPASLSEVVSMASFLESRGFISLKASKQPKDTKLSLRIDEDEVEAAMKDKNLLSGILHDVDCISK